TSSHARWTATSTASVNRSSAEHYGRRITEGVASRQPRVASRQSSLVCGNGQEDLPMTDARAGLHAASTGFIGTEAGFLDLHFDACRPEYEAMLRSVGIQPGWRILDAGCGGGSFLPLLAELVGARGAIAALDMADDSITAVQARAARGEFACSVE